MKMTLYFVQHGLALSKEVDADRPLSAEGRKEVERISSYLEKVGVTVNKICHSGKIRAMETARIFADQIGGGNMSELSGMGPNDDVREFAATLRDDKTMYVGHLPQMGNLVSYLITGDESEKVVKFANGGAVCVEEDNTGFYIEWYLKPSICQV
jgi:phosphohistidine phosphatase